MLSRSTEDYLKAIFEGAVARGAAATTEVARILGVSPASVTGMLKRLGRDGLVQHAPYRGASLTAAGRRVALRVVRRHRVLETYLAAKLGYGWDSVHAEAERLEHAVSDEMVERMAMVLGDPRYDPHGTPIPTAGGPVEVLQGVIDVDDLDRVVSVGPALGWAAAGPHLSQHLAAGNRKLSTFLQLQLQAQEPYWASLATWSRLEPADEARLIHTIAKAYEGQIDTIRHARNRRLAAILRALEEARSG